MPYDDYDTDAQPSPPVLDADTIAGLDPGIRDLVVWMVSLGIPTSDSGDGVSKPDMECALKVPNVFAAYRDDDAPLARIHALLRRCSPSTAATSPAESAFQIGQATINPATFQLTRGRETFQLTPRELKLLQLFHSHPGQVFSRDKLLNEVWGYKYLGTTRTLDQVIVQLRKKLGDNGGDSRHLITVHGVGYKYVP